MPLPKKPDGTIDFAKIAQDTYGSMDPMSGGTPKGNNNYVDFNKIAMDTYGSMDPMSGGTPKENTQLKPPPPDPMEEYRRMQEELKAQQRQSRIASLDTARNNALTALDTEKSSVQPMFYNKRNQAAAASDVNAMNFAQYMASRGIKGAAGAMPEIYRNAGLQGQIGALDQQEAGVLSNIERQRGLINTNYESDVANANADIESQAMQNLMDQWNRNREYNLQLGSLTGTIGDQRTLAGQEFDWSRAASNPEVRARILANQKAELEIAAQEIMNSYLPETLKLDAQRLEQQVKAGSLDYETALAQLNQIKRQTANIGRPNTQQTKANIQQNAQAIISKRLPAFKRPIDFDAQIQREYEQGMIDQPTYIEIRQWVEKNFPDPYEIIRS